MRLADFLRSNSQPILGEWDKFAKHLYPPESLNAAAVRDHARGMLDEIATEPTNVQSKLQQKEKSRGMGPHAAWTTRSRIAWLVPIRGGFRCQPNDERVSRSACLCAATVG